MGGGGTAISHNHIKQPLKTFIALANQQKLMFFSQDLLENK